MGVLLINALLVVPAAAATNTSTSIAQDVRTYFRHQHLPGLIRLYLKSAITVKIGPGRPRQFGVSGTIIFVAVLAFAASMLVPYIRRRYAYLGRLSSAR